MKRTGHQTNCAIFLRGVAVMLTALCGTLLPVHARIMMAPQPGIDLGPKGHEAPVLLATEQPADIFTQGVVLAEGLQSPDGLALDEERGILYVSEEDPARIVRIQPDGRRDVLFDSSTTLYEGEGLSRKRVTGLRSPEGVALDHRENLYVVEDLPGGRLIRFQVPHGPAQPYLFGRVVPLPKLDSRIAWESVSIGPAGELLLAGSTLEAFARETGPVNLFRGIVLYRDAQGEWWQLLNDAMTSYSAAAFSADGQTASFACEITGDVGCLDLRSHILRIYHAGSVFQAPEGLCVLPDGSVLVAEECGRIYRLDPVTDTARLLYDNKSTIESLLWDAKKRRLLVTDDGHGTVLALELKAGLDSALASQGERQIPYQTHATPLEMVPKECPPYLSQILRIGGYDPGGPDAEWEFSAFARRYSLVAIDAQAWLLSSSSPVADPIKRVQFMIVAPDLLGFSSGQLLWSSSGFAARRESGRVVRTELVRRDVLQVDVMESSCTPMGGQTVALPMPFAARVNADGVASINFFGMAVMPDFYFVLNTKDPDKSYLVVIDQGRVEQYALNLPIGTDLRHWVIALLRTQPDTWKQLSLEP